jgi:aldose 1-epimerase
VPGSGDVVLVVAPSGEQFSIARGEQRATIVEVGGGIREYRVGQRDVLDPYPVEAMCDGGHGAVLIPWPNRLADGRYSFDGEDYQLALTEPSRRNAIHGLVRWLNWSVLERADDRVAVGIRLHPLTGWPFPLDLSVAYSLSDDGLMVETRARNIGPVGCPYAAGQHPYLSAGGGLVDECTVELFAGTRIVTDPERQLPVGSEPARGFLGEDRLGDLAVDAAFEDLERDYDGRAWVRLGCPDGASVELWCDEHYRVVQLYTGDTLAHDRRRRALAAEPMTAAANALATGEGIVRLEPGEEHVARWGVRLRGGGPAAR